MYLELKIKLQQGKMQHKMENYELREYETLIFKGIIYVPDDQELENFLLLEMHKVNYVGLQGYQNTITIVKKQYYWPGMKKEVANFIARFLECQTFKAENKHPTGLLHPLPILEWKWELVTMELITSPPRTAKQHDFIMVFVEKITNSTHFIPLKLNHKETNIVDIYLKEVAKLHGIPKEIVSDKDPKFTSNFLKGLLK
jgi:hypothetical protein